MSIPDNALHIPSYPYPWKITIDYQNGEEYQEQLNSIMNINEQGNHVSVMDQLYAHTKDNARIMEICTLAAEKCLLDSDAEYGQILMFSYDCFAKFHGVLQWHFSQKTGEKWEGVTEEMVMGNLEWLRNYFQGEKQIPDAK
jgi:hypothetical protein